MIYKIKKNLKYFLLKVKKKKIKNKLNSIMKKECEKKMKYK